MLTMTETQISKLMINEAVREFIAERGACVAIPHLQAVIHQMALDALADPNNKAKDRTFHQWADAFTAALELLEMETWVDPTDIDWARGMGIDITAEDRRGNAGGQSLI